MPRRIEAASPPPALQQLPLFDGATTPADPGSQALIGAAPVALPALPTTEFRHPRADHELLLNGHLIGYALRRARRRSIGFIVGTEGLSVNAPRWVAMSDIEGALREKAGWIVRKLGEQHERAQRLRAARVEWRDGLVLPYLGLTIVVRLDAATRGATLLDGAPADAPCPLRIGLPTDAAPERIRDAVQNWLQRQARQLFEARCQLYAARLGVRYSRLSLSSARTRWGSASTSGAIRLNWRLVHFALPTVDYVIAHELAHLREMNHGPRFWQLVGSVMPDYRSAMQPLKDEVLPVFD